MHNVRKKDREKDRLKEKNTDVVTKIETVSV
jgi:hypothetical protein